MKTRFLIAVVTGLAAMAAHAKDAPNLCLPGEQVLYQCSVRKELLSLCAVSPRPGAYGLAQLRIGKRRQPPRLVVPAVPVDFVKMTRISRFDPTNADGAHYMYVEMMFEENRQPRGNLEWTEWRGSEQKMDEGSARVGAGPGAISLECNRGSVRFPALGPIVDLQMRQASEGQSKPAK